MSDLSIVARAALVVCATALAPFSASATELDYVLGTSALPSAQGWSHTGSNIGQEVFSASAGTLSWNTMPYEVNQTFSNYSYYSLTPGAGTYDASAWTLFWDVRVQASEPSTPDYYWAGAYTSVSLDGYNLGIGLGTNNISIFKDYYAWSVHYNFALPQSIDDWTMVKLQTTADHRFAIYLDGVALDLSQATLLTTPSALAVHKFGGSAPYVPTWDDTLGGGGPFDTGSGFVIGDGSIGSNAQTETRIWYLTQLENPVIPAVPEPGTWMMFALGLGLLGRARQGRRRGQVLPIA